MEELEDAPWSRLIADQTPQNSPRSFLIAAAVVLAVGVGVGGGRLLFGGDGVAPPPQMFDASATTTTTTTMSPPIADVVVSEADLMALVPTADDLGDVRLRAEWFVTDYFTVDPELSDVQALREALAVESPLLPHDLKQPATSYVDFARSGTVRQIDAGSYAVDVLVKRVVRSDGNVTRLPAETVVVLVGFDLTGTVVLQPPMVDTEANVVASLPSPEFSHTEHVDSALMRWPVAVAASG